MAGSDTTNTRKGGASKPVQEKLRALQDIGRDFESIINVAGAGRAGGERFGEALSDQGKTPEKGGPPEPRAPGALQGLDAMTRNVKFAEALAEERRDLDAGTRARLEGMLGQPLRGVNVYVGKQASAAAKALGAEAFAVGQHVFLQEGKFSTSSAEGLGLLAHELTHTLQDKGSRDDKEAQARAVEARVSQGVRGGSDMELAQDQAPAGALLDQLKPFPGAGPAPGAGTPPDQDMDPAPTHDSPDEKEVERMILERVVEYFRRESDVDLERHGYPFG